MNIKVIREILKYLYEDTLSQDKISLVCRVSKGSVNNIAKKALKTGLNFEQLLDLNDSDLEKQLYKQGIESSVPLPDFGELLDELTKPAVTVQLLFEEYQEKYPDGLKRSAFFKKLKEYKKSLGVKPSMQQNYQGGEYLQVDYSGLKIPYVDPNTNKEIYVDVFVASWAASSYIYAEATASQNQEDWIASNVRALRYFNKAPSYIVPDNLKSGVVKANFYDPDINYAYDEMARYYGARVLPARARKPQDKAGVESNVRFVQNFILGRMRNRKFYSLNDLNQTMREHLDDLNQRPMQRYKCSRKERFEKIDAPNAQGLPLNDFEVLDIKRGIQVNKTHHVQYKGHYYSVPWRFTGARVDLWSSGKTISVYYAGERVAFHPFSNEIGGYTTQKGHRPPEHAYVEKLNPVYVLEKAKEVGPETHSFIVNSINQDPRHCEVIIRKALGVFQLCKTYSNERVEIAIKMAVNFSKLKLKDIQTVLEQGLDLPKEDEEESNIIPLQFHVNLRGSESYNLENQNYNGEC